MNKRILTVGLLLALIGVVLASFYNINEETPKETRITETNSWTAGAYLKKNQTLLVDILPGTNWVANPFDDPPEAAQMEGIQGIRYCIIDVVDPSFNKTTFVVELGYNGKVFYTRPWNVTVVRKSDGLDTLLWDVLITGANRSSYIVYLGAEAAGLAMLDGQYNVTVYGVGPAFSDQNFDPPASITLTIGEVTIEYPYTYFLPLGVGVGTFGIVLCVFGSFKNEKPKRQMKLRFKN
ncbi:MAG: hypothetical protein QXQ94_10620 [Candidatus Bathyarchaeia archaeon]